MSRARLVFVGLASAALALSAAACTGAAQTNPRTVLRAYADALGDGRADDAYALLSDDAKRSISPEAFRTLVKQNKAEALELGKSLSRPTDDPYVTAQVPLATGETLTMVLEDGRWRIDGAALDFYSQATPKQAVLGFLRAFGRRRWDVLLRYTPDARKEGLTEERLKAAWGEGKPEGKRIEEAVEAIRQSIATAVFEETGDRATMSYGSAGVVLFVRERGAWKIEDLR